MEQQEAKKRPTTLKITIAAIMTNVIWGFPWKLIKIMNAELGVDKELLGDAYLGQVLATISIRFFLAGVMTLMFALVIKQNIFKIKPKQWGEVIIMGLLSTTVAYFFFNIAHVNITSTINSAILGQSTIFFAAILAHFAYDNDKLTTRKVIALIIGCIGLIVSQLTGGNTIQDMFSFSLKGEGFMLVYGLVAALATMLAKKLGSTLNSFVLTGWNLIIGATVLFFIGVFMGGDITKATWTPLAITLMIILAACSAVPFSLWYWCAQYAKLGDITVYKFIMPLVGSLVAVALGEKFTMPLAIGLALVCISIILINKPVKEPEEVIENALEKN